MAAQHRVIEVGIVLLERRRGRRGVEHARASRRAASRTSIAAVHRHQRRDGRRRAAVRRRSRAKSPRGSTAGCSSRTTRASTTASCAPSSAGSAGGSRAPVLCTVRLSRALYAGARAPQPRHADGALRPRLRRAPSRARRCAGAAGAAAAIERAARPRGGCSTAIVTRLLRRAARLPPQLAAELADDLPEGPGVYLFRGEGGALLYVGKATQPRAAACSRTSPPSTARARRSRAHAAGAAHRVDRDGRRARRAAARVAAGQGSARPPANRRLRERVRARGPSRSATTARCRVAAIATLDCGRRSPERVYGLFRAERDAGARSRARRASSGAVPEGARPRDRARARCFALPARPLPRRLRRQGTAARCTMRGCGWRFGPRSAAPWPFRRRRSASASATGAAPRSCTCSTAGATSARARRRRIAGPAARCRRSASTRTAIASTGRLAARAATRPAAVRGREPLERHAAPRASFFAACRATCRPAGGGTAPRSASTDAREASGRRRLRGHARERLPRLPASRARPARAAGSLREFPAADAGRAVRRRARDRLGARTSTPTARSPSTSSGSAARRHAHAVRRASAPRTRSSTGSASATGARPVGRPRGAGPARQRALRARRVDVAIDLAGEQPAPARLSRPAGAAPLKENLAAAMLLRAGWPRDRGGGRGASSTRCAARARCVIEAALIAADIAPGLAAATLRLRALAQHDAAAWAAAARGGRRAARSSSCLAPGRIRGYDRDPLAIRARDRERRRAPASASICCFERRDLANLPAAPAPHRARRRQSAVRRAHSARRRNCARSTRTSASAARGLPRLGGGRVHRQSRRSAASSASARDRTHTLLQRPDRVPPAAASRSSPQTSARRASRAGRRAIDAEAARARPGAPMFANRLRKNLDAARRAGRARATSPASASTTPTCPSTRSRSTSTSRTPRAAPGAGSTCRSTRRPRRVDAAKAGARARGGARRAAGGARASRRSAMLLRDAPAAEGRAQYEKLADAASAFHVVARGRAQVPRQLHRLPRHRAVPRPSPDARAARRAREGQALPEPLRVHGHGDGVRGRRRRGRDDHRRHVAHLPRLGEAQPRLNGLRGPRTSSSRRTAWRGSREDGPRAALRPRLPRSADASRTRSAWSASSTCSATTSS